MSLSTGTLYYSPVVRLSIHLSGKCLRDISSYPYFLKKVRNGGCYISLSFTGSHSMCVNIVLFCVGMWLLEAASHWNRSKVVGKMAKGWINNTCNIVRRSCCVHHVSTGVEHNSCEVRPEEEEWQTDSCYNTWTPHTTHGHHTQHMDTTHSTWTPHTTHGHHTQHMDTTHSTWTPHTTHGHHTQHMDTTHNTWTPHMYIQTPHMYIQTPHVHTNTLTLLIIEYMYIQTPHVHTNTLTLLIIEYVRTSKTNTCKY